MESKLKCQACDGTGIIPDGFDTIYRKPCSYCGGTGIQRSISDTSNEPVVASESAPQPDISGFSDNKPTDDDRLEQLRMSYYDERTKAQEMGASHSDYTGWLEQCMLKQLDFAADLQEQLAALSSAQDTTATHLIQDRLLIAEPFGLDRDDVLQDDMEDTLATIKAQLDAANARAETYILHNEALKDIASEAGARAENAEIARDRLESQRP